jgi:hypothetical protein
MLNPWETVRGIEAMEAIRNIPRKLDAIHKEMAKANDLKMVELGLMSKATFQKRYCKEEQDV